MNKEKGIEVEKLHLQRKPSLELYLGHDPSTDQNNIPFKNLHNKVYFKTIEQLMMKSPENATGT